MKKIFCTFFTIILFVSSILGSNVYALTPIFYLNVTDKIANDNSIITAIFRSSDEIYGFEIFLYQDEKLVASGIKYVENSEYPIRCTIDLKRDLDIKLTPNTRYKCEVYARHKSGIHDPSYMQDRTFTTLDRNLIALNESVFLDSNFINLIKDFDNNLDNHLDEKEIMNIKEINFDGHEIISLEGIEYLSSLEKIVVKNVDISSLNIDDNTNLRYIEISNAKLEHIDCGNNIKLQKLTINNTPLQTINLGRNTELKEINIQNTQLKKIDISGIVNLNKITIQKIPLEKVDFRKNEELIEVNLSTKCTSYDFRQNNKLETLNISSGYDNVYINKLRLGKQSRLTNLNISNSKIKKLWLNNLKNLRYLSIKQNYGMNKLNIIGNKKLSKVSIKDTNIKILNVKNNKRLTKLTLKDNKQLKKVTVKSSKIKKINLKGTKCKRKNVSVSKKIKVKL